MHKLGTILLILGIAVWIPFFLLLLSGQEPSISPFLLVHLTGVIGGGRLRAVTTPVEERQPQRKVWGRLLIMLGVFAWVPWLYQTEVLGREPRLAPYLTLHLIGVLSGFGLLLGYPLYRIGQRLHVGVDDVGLSSHGELEEQDS